jgi:hypothetical protein
MMSKERKNVLAAVLLVAVVLTVPIPAHAKQPASGVRDAGPVRAWVVRILDWLGMHPTRIGSVWEASSANIDPNGQP